MNQGLDVGELRRHHPESEKEHPMRNEGKSEGWVSGRQMFPARFSSQLYKIFSFN